MKQKNYTLNLRQYADESNPYGTSRGRKAHGLLVRDIDVLHGASVVGISLADIEAADVSFSEKALSIPLNDIVSRLRFMFLILLMKIYFPTYTVLQFPVIKA